MRRLSGLERVWLAARVVGPPYCNQLVLEGQGWPQAPGGWDDLLTRLVAAQPGCRVHLRGMLWNTRWEASGPLPTVRELDGSGWDGLGPEGAPFLAAPMDPRRGPALEILLLRGQPTRVVLRTLAAAADGAGLLMMARGLFDCLRGDEPLPATEGPEQDEILARSLGVQPEPPPPQDAAALTGPADPGQQGCTWRRIRVPPFPAFVTSLALGLARAAEVPAGAVLRMEVPVDLRRYAPALQSTASLTGWMRLPVHLHLGAEEPVASLRYALQDALRRKAAAATSLGLGFARATPLWLLSWLGRRLAAKSLREGRFGSSAVLSHAGRLDLGEFSGGGFQAQRAWFVPAGSPGQPAFVTTTIGPEGVELAVAMPNALASGGRLEALLDRLRRDLTTNVPALGDNLGAPAVDTSAMARAPEPGGTDRRG
ncbi:MAG: hypothetical protein ABIO70_03315 [Pseudomonadota bacterium]